MNWSRIQRDRKPVAADGRPRWEKSADQDMSGRRDQPGGRMRERYGIAEDDADMHTAKWQRDAPPAWTSK